MSEFRGLIVAVSGPSGVGKGTVLAKVEELLEQANPGSVGHSISVTTRAPRGQEKDGIEYFFRTKEQFEQMIKDGEIVEYDTYVDNYYGTPAGPLKEMVSKGQDVLFDITIEGSLALNRKFDVDTVTIFILPPSMEELENRLRGRGTETEEKIQKRLTQAKSEIGRAGEFEYLVTNGDLDTAAREIVAIITAEKLKASKNIDTAKALL
ncbi:MAG: guanylate kinase [Clostridiales bacterium]|nr:guanylate kinase [Clostridiales bacterium]MBR6488475.1 guanylate kinase [Clostridiales bacterium]